MTTFLDIAYWTIPAVTVAALIVRDEHRIHATRNTTTKEQP